MDIRVEKTYTALTETFERLLETNKFEDITVSMLCDESLIRRTTFYKHFNDKNDFFRFYVKQKRAELQEACCADALEVDFGVYRVYFLDSIMTFLVKNESLVNNLAKSSQSPLLLSALSDFLKEDIVRVLQKRDLEKTHPAEYDYDYMAASISGSAVHTIKLWWINGHKQKDRAKVIEANAFLEVAVRIR